MISSGKGKRCKDCSTDKVITVPWNEKYEYPIAVELCSPCLTMRAQLQSMREDKLSFPALIKKIRGEIKARLASEMKRSVLQEYKGVNPYAVFKVDYWVEQLCCKGE